MSSKGIRVKRSEFLRALDPIAAIQGSKPTSPIYGMTRVDLKDGVITLEGHAPSASVKSKLPAPPGFDLATLSFTFVTAGFREKFAGLPEGEIEIQPSAERLTMVAGKKKAHVGAIASADLPTPAEPPTADFEFDGGEFVKIIKRLLPAMSLDPSRPGANGVQLRGGKALTTRSSHGLMAALPESLADADVLLPAGFVSVLQRLDSGPWKLGYDKSRVVVITEKQTVVHGLTDGVFPPLEQVVPKGKPVCKAWALRSDLESMVKLAAAGLADADPSKQMIRISVVDDEIRVDSPACTFEDTIAAVTTNTLEQIGIGDSPLSDGISLFGGCDKVDLQFFGELDPIVIRSGADDDEDLAILMPMRLK